MLLWSRFLLQVLEIAFRTPVFFFFAFWVFLYTSPVLHYPCSGENCYELQLYRTIMLTVISFYNSDVHRRLKEFYFFFKFLDCPDE